LPWTSEEDALFLESYRVHVDAMAARFPGIAATAPEGEIAVLGILRTASLILGAVSRNLSRFGISESAFNVLTLLAGRPEGLTQTELSRYLIVSRANVTGLVDRLTQKGLVARHDDPRDRRVSVITLTPGGWDLLDRVVPAHYRFLNGLLAGLENRRWQDLTRLLAQVRRTLTGLPEKTE